jgi:hypothetical protein
MLHEVANMLSTQQYLTRNAADHKYPEGKPALKWNFSSACRIILIEGLLHVLAAEGNHDFING